MQTLAFKRAMVLSISLALISALSVTTVVGQQKTKVAGKITAAYTKQEIIDVGDIEGHGISLGESEGTNFGTGKPEFMDGAQVVNLATADLVKGNGPQQGYIKFAKKGDTSIAKWEGKVATTLSTEGVPITTFEGTFSWIKGTGQLANIQGSGTYKGKYISKTIYTVEWEGEYSIKK